MENPHTILEPVPIGQRLRTRVSNAALGLAALLLGGTFLLISPPEGQRFPGALPWSDNSLLKGIIDAMSLGGLVHTIRGAEIKDLAFHLAALGILLILAARAVISARWPAERRTTPGAWLWAQAALALWVVLSFASAMWSGDPQLSIHQATLYALALAWAIGLAWTLEVQSVPGLLFAYVAIAAAGGGMCVWYFHERNPFHRPGFPIGNPSPLSACVMPATLLCLGYLAGQLIEWTRSRKWDNPGLCLAAAAALVPLTWCFKLSGSRGAALGAVVGVVATAWMRVGRRVRWASFVLLLLIAIGAGSYFATRSMELTMARGETLRFRAYAWQYAAMLWSQRTISGHGAGSYPRLANVLSLQDRRLDPAAFMADLVEHAHNELFEVLAEIGLIGGLTFVVGYVATVLAGRSLLLGNLSTPRRYLLMGLVAGVIGLLVDACVGVGLRLPGLPAVHFTLLGVLWSLCRSASKSAGGLEPAPAKARRRAEALVAGGAVVLACVLAVPVARNWSGVQAEYSASRAAAAGEFATAAELDQRARQELLDPVRSIVAEQQEVLARVELAGQGLVKFRKYRAALGGAEALQSQPTDRLNALQEYRREGLRRTEQAFKATVTLSQRVRTFGKTLALAARCSEWMAELADDIDPPHAADWRNTALQAWTMQHQARPYDVETLLALAQRYPASIEQRLGYLRDALRAGFPGPDWLQTLRAALHQPGATAILHAMTAAVGPFNPQTELDSLVLSMAPEMLRMAGWAERTDGATSGPPSQPVASEPGGACELFQRAAALYQPMHARFPELFSVALAEQADCEFRRTHDPDPAIDLLRAALDALPIIQEQKYQDMARPYRVHLAQYLVAAGQVDEARQMLMMIPLDEADVAKAIEALRKSLESMP